MSAPSASLWDHDPSTLGNSSNDGSSASTTVTTGTSGVVSMATPGPNSRTYTWYYGARGVQLYISDISSETGYFKLECKVFDERGFAITSETFTETASTWVGLKEVARNRARLSGIPHSMLNWVDTCRPGPRA